MFDHAKLQIQGLGPPWALTPGPGYFCHTKTASSLLLIPSVLGSSWLLMMLGSWCHYCLGVARLCRLTSRRNSLPTSGDTLTTICGDISLSKIDSCILIMVSMLHNSTQRGAVGISVDSGTGFYPVFSVYLRHFNRIFLLSSYFCFLFFQLMSLNTSNSQHLQRQDNTN